MAHRRRHAGETGFDGTVSEDGSGYGGSVRTCIDPQVLGLVGPAEPEEAEVQREVGAANALPVGRDVGMADIESGVHDADRDRGPADAREETGSPVVSSQGIGAHGGNSRVEGGFEDPDGLDGQHEIGGGNRLQSSLGNVGRIDPDVRVEAAHLHSQILERPPPAGVGIAGHQGDVHGRHFPGGGVGRRVHQCLGEFSLRGQGAQPIDLRQGRDRLQAGLVAREPGANEHSRGTGDPGARAFEHLRQVIGRGVPGEPDPAEGPVTSGRGGLSGQPLDRSLRPQPVEIRQRAFTPGGHLTLESLPGHLTMVGDERIAGGRGGRGVLHGLFGDGRGRGRSRRGLNGRFTAGSTAFLGNPGRGGSGHPGCLRRGQPCLFPALARGGLGSDQVRRACHHAQDAQGSQAASKRYPHCRLPCRGQSPAQTVVPGSKQLARSRRRSCRAG